MGDKATLAKARRELEEFYSGVVDDSLDLSFKDFASFEQDRPRPAGRKPRSIEPIEEEEEPEGAAKLKPICESLPSLDLRKGLQATQQHHQHFVEEVHKEQLSHSPRYNSVVRSELRGVVDSSLVHNDASYFSTAAVGDGVEARGGRRRRPGIPHSNICALCTVYIYIFRNRCLVCGRVFCRQCVDEGMGEMAEGRKCVECLGRRFSQRYIQTAGQTGCCGWRYSSLVKQQELKWAEKGPRRSGEKQYEKRYMASRSQFGRSVIDSRSQYGRSAIESRSINPLSTTQPGNSRMAGPTKFPAEDASASFVTSSAYFPTAHAFPV